MPKLIPIDHNTGRPTKKNRGSGHLYTEMRKRILSLELPPGTELDETTLAEEYGISRTPVREALIRLSTDSLIILVPNHSPRVAPLELSDIRVFNESLQLCQRIVSRWAAGRRTSKDLDTIDQYRLQHKEAVRRGNIDELVEANRGFHSAIGAACGNPYFAATYDRLLYDGMRLVRIAMTVDNQDTQGPIIDYLNKTTDEHDELLSAIRLQDLDKAEALAGDHAKDGMSRIADYILSTMAVSIDLSSI
ncbi:MAG: GntR family transcriptional regulator [Rhodospirillaceae bacterium]|nr:GntR family transcriptional regulator [Rhodospirillaceae bacterium]